MIETVDLTPDYQALYAQFTHDLPQHMNALLAEPTLPHFQDWLYSFTVAFNCATTAKQVLELRAQANLCLEAVAKQTRDQQAQG